MAATPAKMYARSTKGNGGVVVISRGLRELAEHMRPEKIMAMSYDEIAKILTPQFFYIGLSNINNLWKWKINALTVMMNDFKEGYVAPIKSGLGDTDKRVRKFAKKICSKLRI